MTSAIEAPRAYLEESRDWIEARLERALPPPDRPPARLHEAMRYALFGGGKRLRPALVRLVCKELGGTDEDAAAPAAAVELVHTYSLVHDDLPCMDDDELRRGRATCHVVYGDALAVLVGDALLTLAFELCAGVGGERGGELAASLARGAGSVGMVGGQALDVESESREVTPDEVASIHLWKTAALFRASCEMGAIAAGADGRTRGSAARYGEALGLLFQAVDDLLDVTGDAATLGKTPGKDAAVGKATFVAALGLEGARAEAERLAGEARDAALELGLGVESLPVGIVELVLARRS